MSSAWTVRHGAAREDGLEIYREELGCIAGGARGLLTVTDVELVADDGDH